MGVQFDTPGHVFPSWCNGAAGGPDSSAADASAGYPQICTACSKKHTGDSGWGPLRADLNSTYDFLTKLFSEVRAPRPPATLPRTALTPRRRSGQIASVFPEKYVHLGGDEVSFDCWCGRGWQSLRFRWHS